MINLKHLHPTMGSLVIDKRLTDFTDDEITELKDLILDRRAIFFENQFLTQNEMLDVADRLQSENGFRRYSEIDNADEAHYRYGFDWHSDKIFSNKIPNYTIFQILELPDNTKGDTEFLDSVGFFEYCFSPQMKSLFLELKAIFELRAHQEELTYENGMIEFKELWTRSVHDVILRTQTSDGRQLRSMTVNPCHTKSIVGFTNPESDAIIRCIVDTMYRRAEYKYRHRWNEGGLVIWSNRVCLHKGVKDFEFGFKRKFNRVLVY